MINIGDNRKLTIDVEERFRQTGRTYRLIQDMLSETLNQDVYFVVKSNLVENYKRKLDFNSRIKVISDLNPNIDWNTLSLKGIKNKVYFDHSVLYRRYKHIIDLYLEYTKFPFQFDLNLKLLDKKFDLY